MRLRGLDAPRVLFRVTPSPARTGLRNGGSEVRNEALLT